MCRHKPGFKARSLAAALDEPAEGGADPAELVDQLGELGPLAQPMRPQLGIAENQFLWNWATMAAELWMALMMTMVMIVTSGAITDNRLRYHTITVDDDASDNQLR